MKLNDVKKVVESIGLDVDQKLILYQNGIEVGKIFKIEGTDQFSFMASFPNGFNSTPNPNLEGLVEVEDTIRLGSRCNMPGKLAIIEEVNKSGVLAYVEHPTDKDKKAYFKMPYGSFELISSEKTVQ